MKFVTFIIFFLCVFASALRAQTINVRAGDHATFTRLVFYVDESVAWNVNEATSEIDIKFSDFAGKIDHTRVFEPISRNSCLLYTSPSPRDQRGSRMPSSA